MSNRAKGWILWLLAILVSFTVSPVWLNVVVFLALLFTAMYFWNESDEDRIARAEERGYAKRVAEENNPWTKK